VPPAPRSPRRAAVAGLPFPHAVQAIRITRPIRFLGQRRWRTVTVYAITNLTAYQASPAHLADYIRGHWGIEALYYARDTTYADYAELLRGESYRLKDKRRAGVFTIPSAKGSE
jgi:hypothetical protein